MIYKDGISNFPVSTFSSMDFFINEADQKWTGDLGMQLIVVLSDYPLVMTNIAMV